METERSFGAWLRRRRRLLDLTQAELAQRVGCAVVTIRKLEADELRPSKQMAERLAQCLEVISEEYERFTAFARSTPPAPVADALPVRHNLPHQLTPFVGRPQELADLAALLADPSVRLLTILGPGGIGKTRLALEAATAQLDRFTHGVFFVSLAAVDTPHAIIPLVAEALDFTFYEGKTPQQQLCDYLRHKNMLLVLDNFEQLLDDAPHPEPEPPASVALLLNLLQAAPGLKILVTSRTRLNVQGEQSYAIDGIDVPQPGQTTVTAAGQTSAVRLFVQSAHRVRADFALTDENVAAVSALCRLVHGMPLALVLAAGWVDMLTPAEILAELRPEDEAAHSLDLFTGELRDAPARHRSLRAVFDHSWRLLTPAEQALFAQLAVFRDGFTRQAAEEILDLGFGILDLPQHPVPPLQNPKSKIQNSLRSLVGKSLVRRQPESAGAGRYDLHELVRQYAAARLAERPTLLEAVRGRHSAYYCAWLGEQEDRLKGPEQQTAVTQVEADSENVRAAWQWAVAQGRMESLQQGIHSLGMFFEWRNRYVEGETLFAATAHNLQAREALSHAAHLLFCQVLAWQSLFYRLTWRLKQAHHLLQQSLEMLDNLALPARTPDIEIQRASAFTLFQLGCLSLVQEEFVIGRQCYDQALELCQAHDDAWGEANVLAGLGEIEERSGNFQLARQRYEESLLCYRRLGDQRGSAHALGRLGSILQEYPHLETAEQVIREAIALYQVVGDRAQIAHRQYSLGWCYLFSGRFVEARALIEGSIMLWTELGLPTPNSKLALTVISVELGDYQAAQQQVQLQLPHIQALGDKDAIGLALDVLACLATIEGRYAEAQQLAAEGMALNQETGRQHRLAHSFAWLGYAARGLGRRAEAQQNLVHALQLTVANQGFSALLFVLAGIALLLADEGQVERAVEVYAQIAHRPIVANSRMRWDLAGRQLAAMAAALPPEAASAARTRGRAGDPWQKAAALLIELKGQGWAQSLCG
jgi:predicted ATPase/DNA-binding XRE family transcriptional regulator